MLLIPFKQERVMILRFLILLLPFEEPLLGVTIVPVVLTDFAPNIDRLSVNCMTMNPREFF